jgi:hypothetical protein
VGVGAGDSEREFVQVCLADDDAAGCTHRANDRRVRTAPLYRKDSGTGGGHGTPNIDDVLDSDDRSVIGLVGQRNEGIQVSSRADPFARQIRIQHMESRALGLQGGE